MKKKWIIRLGILLFVLLAILIVSIIVDLLDRHPGYKVDLTIRESPVAPLRAGFSAVSITPKQFESWNDEDGDAQFGRRDKYQDENDNGDFEAVWMAGFQNKRPARGVHDELWARTMIIDDGTSRIGLVALDAIGFMADEIIDIRKRLSSGLEVDYLIITSTHTHEGPDLLGLWGTSYLKTGVDPVYMEYVKLQILRAVGEAVENLRPALLRFAQDLDGAAALVEDSRRPIVLDPGIRLLQAIDTQADTTLGTLFAWANHPETLWSGNLMLSSDFPHYLREAMEKGVFAGDSLAMAGVGGTCIYLNGAIGGLMTTSPSFGIKDPFRDTTYTEPSFPKARAQGERLALLGLKALQDTTVVEIAEGAITLRAKTFKIPLANNLYRLAATLGVIDRGFSGFLKLRTEVACWTLGPAAFLHQPGELYPEILNGGVVTPQGSDYSIPPVETPPLRNFMPGEFKFVVGLSNDMIGYIIPKSEWDDKPPYLYDAEESPYGEINSVGPETGPRLYQAMWEVIEGVK